MLHARKDVAARTRVNLRAGPGTNHRVVGSLAAGQAVQATGRAGAWLRIARPGGGAAFVHGDFMVASAGQEQPTQDRSPAPALSPKCPGMGKGAECWLELANKFGCYIFDPGHSPGTQMTWSGACSGSIAIGRGTLEWKSARSSGNATGAMVRGKWHGRWVFRSAGGGCFARQLSHGKFVAGSLKRC